MSSNEYAGTVSTDPLTSMALGYNSLMKEFIAERIDNPYNLDGTLSKYVAEAITILQTAAEQLGAINEERAEMLDDALLLAKCFAATVLGPPQPSNRMEAFLNFVDAVQPDLSRFQPKIIEQIQKDHTDSLQFWELLRHFLLIGHLNDAHQLLLSRFADPQTDGQIDDLAQLVKTYPLKLSKQSSFMRWRQTVLSFLHNLQAQGSIRGSKDESQVEQIALILSGDTSEILRSSGDWIEALCGLSLYSDPTFESLELNFSSANERLGLEVSPTWEEGCKALFEDRIVAALSSLKLLELGTAVVFSEFCNEANLLQKYSSIAGTSGSANASTGRVNGGIREELGLEYVELLLWNSATVEIGLEMLANIGSDAARAAAETQLPELVKRFPSQAELAVNTADQLGLSTLDATLSRTAAHSHWSAHRYIPALELFHRSGDYTSLRDCSWDLFEEILITRDVPEARLEDQTQSDEEANDESTLTATVLRDFSSATNIGLSPMILDSIAPSAVLLQLLDALYAENVEAVVDNIRGLLMLPNDKLQYYPLLVSLLSNATPGTLPVKDTVMLMDALDVWDGATPEIKHQSEKLIERAAKQPNWQEALESENKESQKRAVWFLRKHLAKSIVL